MEDFEIPNVNNLNGVPNFGHGFTKEEVIELTEEGVAVPTEDIVSAIDEVDLEVETEVNETKSTRKRKG